MASEQISSATTIRPYIEANFHLQAPTVATPGKTLVPNEPEAEWAIQSECSGYRNTIPRAYS